MLWLWLQSLVLIALTFSLGLVLGHVVSAFTRQARPEPVVETAFDTPEPYAPYHGYDVEPQPVPAVAEPLPPRPEPAAPPRRIKPAVLFPINQFGIVTVTQAPAI
ncbi:hypothetical protein ABI_27740 [Asticcacaulis biprosthecium C19]|uniref:Uncharacterized protein n=1 Tax=Asticcacaulis biprosthecium C19 TaxID=715226 RepID=F4QMB8_9CAUL|nr:hypothetical protein [Asticcacaulis biprosthecium]EGF91359.1 hypothetical protein ABI_27740 [Asticcacaulis biprosthecium C19]